MKLKDSRWPDVKGSRVVTITGSLEQHGPHLPLSTDTLIAEAVAEKVAVEVGAVLGPTIPVGVSPEHMSFPGTVSLKPDTFKSVVEEVVESLRRQGFAEIIIINGHGGNNKALEELNIDVKAVNLTSLLERYDHAGEVETSLMMHLHPELVKEDEIREHEFRWPGRGEWKDTKEFSESGVLGDPTRATSEKGSELFRQLAERALASM
ncbi:MAG: creatininase family protein [Candidatus Altiarchaeales archaeon]|nr:creatininase family protein [Candidatus Altiarchaeales archaeon]MBD3415925.1 creatininase family protein [Candidatus Altiarchaeales archaeon]